MQDIKQHEEHSTTGHKSDLIAVGVKYVATEFVERNGAISSDQLSHGQDRAMHRGVLKGEVVQRAVLLPMLDVNFALIRDEVPIGALVLDPLALRFALADLMVRERLFAVCNVRLRAAV